MTFKNVFTVYQKRIFTKKMYIFTLVMLLALTIIYKCLPDAEKAADIKVGIYMEDAGYQADRLAGSIKDLSSVYSFYIADSEKQLTDNIKSGHTECGYVIPEGFFDSYISGLSGEHNIILYTAPGTTLSEAISETLFSNIYKLCSGDILHYAAAAPDLEEQLDLLLHSYIEGDEIFRVSDSTGGRYIAGTEIYTIDIPVYELSLILMIFAGLLGLLTYMNDSEREIFIALPDSDRLLLLTSAIASAVLPIYALSIVSCAITYGTTTRLAALSLCAFLSFGGSVLLKPIIRKSTVLKKVLPVIMLCGIVVIFVRSIL
ncbi:MAG: hypothetical protein NC240_10770 [Clostridium sp.]|nr:hypothetical protein [Clostridium sp.]